MGEVSESTQRARAMLLAAPDAAARAREFLGATLDEAGVEEDRRFEALLVTSELVANAVTHGSRAGDEIGLDVSLDGTLLRIAVSDAARARTAPVALTPDEQRPTGRGLAVVEWLAEWSERVVDGRREVRAELTL